MPKTDPDSWVIWQGTGPIYKVEKAGELVFAG
jgi:hypothetical protein